MQSPFLSFITILVIAFCSSATIQAQDDHIINTKKLGFEDGLLGERVTVVYQDKAGFIWVGTQDGLNRFDGHRFKWFNQSNSKLNYRDIRYGGINEDREGYLWLLYKNDVEFIHSTTFEVKTFEERFKDTPFKPKEIIQVRNTSSSLYIQTLGSKIYILNEDNTIRYLSFLDGLVIYDMTEEGVWYYKNEKLIQSDFDGNIIKTYPNLTSELRLLHSYSEKDKMFYSFEKGGVINIYQYQNFQLKEISRNIIPKGIMVRSARYLPKVDKVLLLTNFEKEQVVYLLDMPNNDVVKIDLEGYTWSIYFDKNDILWTSTLKGLTLINIQSLRFDIYKEAYRSRGIWANETDMYIFSDGPDKSYRFDIKTKQAEEIAASQMFSTAVHDKKNFWRSGSSLLKTNLADLTALEFIPRSSSINGKVWASLQDNDKKWWLSFANNTGRLGIYHPNEQDSIILFEQYNAFEDLKRAFIIHFLEDGNYIWASSNKGLILIDKDKGVVQHYHKSLEAPFQLPFTDVYWLHKDKNGVYWAATNHDGLIRFELNDKKEVIKFKQYTSFDNLSSNVIYTIFEDDNERLWMSTLRGISCFDTKTEEILTFSTQDGLPSNEFNRISGFQALDGRIYFGALEGAVGFHPNDVIQKTSYDIDLLLSSVQKYSSRKETLVDFTSEALNSQTIIQQPYERFIKIEVALADFFHAKSLRYYYQIKGLHDDFRLMDGNSVQLSNLPYGKYRMVIKGQATDKRFSTKEVTLTLRIVRPFYLRWWFILLSIAAVILSSWQFYNYRVAQLRRQKQILEQTVQERTEQIRKDKLIIEEQAEQLKALDKLKDRFFTNISHELRTPLTLILSPLSTLLKSKNLSNKEYTYTRIIQRHAQYLLKRINEIMELNRLEANKSQVNEQAVRFYDLIKIAVSSFESIAPQKNITFLFDYQMSQDLQVYLDKDKYEHILYNYLSNAFKYTSKNGKIEVIVTTINNKLLLEVKDTGVGIPAENLSHIFERFYQANNADKSSSSGIGLALCKEIATLVNGLVWVESEVGKGSSFFFEMPYKEVLGVVESEQVEIVSHELASLAGANLVVPLENGISNLRGLEASKSKPNILLVEDNADLRNYIQSVLSEHYNVETAENGQIALGKLNTQHSITQQLIISDIMMPVMDGLELLETIKQSDEFRHIPMVMLTARSSMEAKLSALQLGVDDYITKPFNEEELLIRVQNLLNNQKERLTFIREINASDTLEVSDTQISKSNQNWLKEVERIVNENLHNSQFTKLDWAIELNISDRQLRRKVKQLTGLTLTKYLQLARLKKAREILESGEKSTVAEVSYAVGFETPKYFSKIFKAEYGKRPVEYF